MADVFTKAKRSAVMSLIRSRGNRDTELRTIALLRAYRIRGWRRRTPLTGKPDFVFPVEKVAVFCGWLLLARLPSSRTRSDFPRGILGAEAGAECTVRSRRDAHLARIRLDGPAHLGMRPGPVASQSNDGAHCTRP
jgi:hypothetical protein